MVENTLVKEQLTDAMVQAGAELLAKLDEMQFPVAAALWLFDPDHNEWRLTLASPEYSTVGPLVLYHRVGEARRALKDRVDALPRFSVWLVDSNDPLVPRLRKSFGAINGISRIRSSRRGVDGYIIEEALIYRVA